MPFEQIIFDCDGVLVDSERLAHELIVRELAQRGIAMTLDAAFDRFLGKSTAQSLEILRTLLIHESPAEFMEQYRIKLRHAFHSDLRAVAGIAAALDAVVLPYSVASSGELEKMRTTLGIAGLLPRFEGKLTSVTEVAHPKPAPDVYLLAAKRAGVSPQACLVIEDSPTGVAAGVAAGMTVYGYSAHTRAERLRAVGATLTFAEMSLLPSLVLAQQRMHVPQ